MAMIGRRTLRAGELALTLPHMPKTRQLVVPLLPRHVVIKYQEVSELVDHCVIQLFLDKRHHHGVFRYPNCSSP